jgi:hypothetical protein
MRTMLAESTDEEQIIARVAALDVGKAELVCCVRVPGTVAGRDDCRRCRRIRR